MSDLDNEEIEATRLLKNINEKELDELIKSTEESIEATCKFLRYPVVAIVQEKSADEMFEKLGYTKEIFGKSRIAYGFTDEYGYFLKNIWFNKVIKRVETPSAMSFCMQELKAINKKCKELRLARLGEIMEIWKDIERIQ